MLSFYHFPTWVFAFFLLATGISIFFYTRKFLRLLTLVQKAPNQNQPKERSEKEIKVKANPDWALPIKVSQKKKTFASFFPKLKQKYSDDLNKKAPFDIPDARLRYRDSMASNYSWESTTTDLSGYQEPDLSSVITSDQSTKRFATGIVLPPYVASSIDQNQNLLAHEIVTSTPLLGVHPISANFDPCQMLNIVQHNQERSCDESPVSKSFLSSSTKLTTTSENISHSSHKIPIEKAVQNPPRWQLDKNTSVKREIPSVISVRSSSAVKELVTKSESSIERIMITENLQQKNSKKY